MAEVKICGITTPDALDAAVEGGARFVGFVAMSRPSAWARRAPMRCERRSGFRRALLLGRRFCLRPPHA